MAAPSASRASLLHLSPSAAVLLQASGESFPRHVSLSFFFSSVPPSNSSNSSNSFNNLSSSGNLRLSSSASVFPVSSRGLPECRRPLSSSSSGFEVCRSSSSESSSTRCCSRSTRSPGSCSRFCSISRLNCQPGLSSNQGRRLGSSCSSSETQPAVLQGQTCSSRAVSGQHSISRSDSSSYSGSSDTCSRRRRSSSSAIHSSSSTCSRRCLAAIAGVDTQQISKGSRCSSRMRLLLSLPFTLRCCGGLSNSSSRLLADSSGDAPTATSGSSRSGSSTSPGVSSSSSSGIAGAWRGREAEKTSGRWWKEIESGCRRSSKQEGCSSSKTVVFDLPPLCSSGGGGSASNAGTVSRSCSTSSNPPSSSSSLGTIRRRRDTEARDSGAVGAGGGAAAAAAAEVSSIDSSSIEARSAAFDAAFEESELGRDEYNNVSDLPPSYIFRVQKAAAATQQHQHKQDSPVVHPRLRRAASYFYPPEAQAGGAGPKEGGGAAAQQQQGSSSKRPRRDKGRRFRLEGLKVDEGPYQRSLYEELQQQEQQQRQQQQICAARRQAKLLSAASTSAAAAAAAEAEAAVRLCHAQPAATAALCESLAAEERRKKDAAAAVPSLEEAVLLEEQQQKSHSCSSSDRQPVLRPVAAAAAEKKQETTRVLPSLLMRPAPVAEAQRRQLLLQQQQALREQQALLQQEKEEQEEVQQQTQQQQQTWGREEEPEQLEGTKEEGEGEKEEEEEQELLLQKRRKKQQQEQRGGRRTHAAAMEAARKATMGARQEQLQWLSRFEEEEGICGGIRSVEPPAAKAAGAAEKTDSIRVATAAAAGDTAGGESAAEERATALASDLMHAASEQNEATSSHRSSAAAAASLLLEATCPPSPVETAAAPPSPPAAAAARGGEDSDAAAAAEVRDAFSPAAIIEAATGLQPDCWQQLPPQQLQTQVQLLRSRTVGHVLQAIGAAAAQVPEESVEGSLFASPAAAAAPPPLIAASASAAAAEVGASSAVASPACCAVANLHAVNVATAVHRLGRLAASPAQAAAVRSDPRFVLLLQAAEQQLPRMQSVGLCSLLWGLVQLEAAPGWLAQLLLQCQQAAADMRMRQLSCLLFCCSRMPYPSKEAQSLVHTLVHAIAVRLASRGSSSSFLLRFPESQAQQHAREKEEGTDSRDDAQQKKEDFLDEEEWGASPLGTLACISGSLGRLKVKDAAVFAAVAQHLLRLFMASSPSPHTSSSLSLSSPSDDPPQGSLVHSSSSISSSISSKPPTAGLRSSSRTGGSAGLSAGELATIAWGFGRAGFLDRRLCAWLKKFFAHALDDSSAREIASFAWGMARLQQADEDFLLLTLSPAIRSLLVDFKAKELGILLWVYTEAGVHDAELMGDLLFALQPKLKTFSPHDVMLVAVTLSQQEQQLQPPALSSSSSIFSSSRGSSSNSFWSRSSRLLRETYRGLRERMLLLLPQFSPLQLSRAIYGLGVGTARCCFSAAEDLRFWRLCCDHVQQRLHAFYPQNLTHILVGLSEAEYLCQHPVTLLLLQQLASDRVLPMLFAEDCVQLLYVLSKLQQQQTLASSSSSFFISSFSSASAQGRVSLPQQQQLRDTPQQQQGAYNWRELQEVQRQLLPLLLQQLRNKVRLLWSLDCVALGDFFEALQTLQVFDEELLHACMRRLAAVVAAATPRDALRLLGCLASLSSTPQLLVRTHIHRRSKLQAAFHEKLAAVAACSTSSTSSSSNSAFSSSCSSSKDLQSRIVLLYACARLGLHNEHTDRVYEEIQHAVESEGACLSLPALCRLLWAMAETNVRMSWSRSLLRYFLHRRYSAAAATAAAAAQQQQEALQELSDQETQQEEAVGSERMLLLLETVEERENYCMQHGLGAYRGGEVFLLADSLLFPCPAAAAEEEEKAEDMQTAQQTSTSGCAAAASAAFASASAAAALAAESQEEAAAKKKAKYALGEALLHAAFAAVVLGEEDFLMPLLEEIALLLDGELPPAALLLNAQQVCLHAAKLRLCCADEQQQQPSARLQEWLQLVLDAPRTDVFFGEGGAAAGGGGRRKAGSSSRRKRVVREFNYDLWLSEPLVQMRIPHKRTFVVENIYRVSAAFPLERHLIDVLAFQDLLCPSGKPSGTAELRQRQLALLGWTVHSVHLRSLHNALVDNNLRLVVGNIAATFSNEALRQVTFQKQLLQLSINPQQQEQQRLQVSSYEQQQHYLLTEGGLQQSPQEERQQQERLGGRSDAGAEGEQQRTIVDPEQQEQQRQQQSQGKKQSHCVHFELEDDEDCRPSSRSSRINDFWGSTMIVQQQQEPAAGEDAPAAAAADASTATAAVAATAAAAARLARSREAASSDIAGARAAWNPETTATAAAEKKGLVLPTAATEGAAAGRAHGVAAAGVAPSQEHKRESNSSSKGGRPPSAVVQQESASPEDAHLSSDAFQRILCQE